MAVHAVLSERISPPPSGLQAEKAKRHTGLGSSALRDMEK